jgi:hypothetical protein
MPNVTDKIQPAGLPIQNDQGQWMPTVCPPRSIRVCCTEQFGFGGQSSLMIVAQAGRARSNGCPGNRNRSAFSGQIVRQLRLLTETAPMLPKCVFGNAQSKEKYIPRDSLCGKKNDGKH